MLFKNEKYKKDVKDVMLVFLYLGLLFMIFSSLISNFIFCIDIQIIGGFFLGIGSGMGLIIAYYYRSTSKAYPKKKHKISIERMLELHVFIGLLLLFLTIVLLFYIKIGIL